jgi:hypothetical protein
MLAKRLNGKSRRISIANTLAKAVLLQHRTKFLHNIVDGDKRRTLFQKHVQDTDVAIHMANGTREGILRAARRISMRNARNTLDGIEPSDAAHRASINNLGINVALKITAKHPAPLRRCNRRIVFIGPLNDTLLNRWIESRRRPVRNQYRRIELDPIRGTTRAWI